MLNNQMVYHEVSYKSGGVPGKIIHVQNQFYGIFHYKTTIFVVPLFMENPNYMGI